MNIIILKNCLTIFLYGFGFLMATAFLGGCFAFLEQLIDKKIIKMLLPAFVIVTIAGGVIVGMVSHDLQNRMTGIIISDLCVIMIYVLMTSIINSLRCAVTYLKKIIKTDGLKLKNYLSLFFFGFNATFFTFIAPVYWILYEKVLYTQ